MLCDICVCLCFGRCNDAAERVTFFHLGVDLSLGFASGVGSRSGMWSGTVALEFFVEICTTSYNLKWLTPAQSPVFYPTQSLSAHSAQLPRDTSTCFILLAAQHHASKSPSLPPPPTSLPAAPPPRDASSAAHSPINLIPILNHPSAPARQLANQASSASGGNSTP
jgi:hypothetical protein